MLVRSAWRLVGTPARRRPRIRAGSRRPTRSCCSPTSTGSSRSTWRSRRSSAWRCGSLRPPPSAACWAPGAARGGSRIRSSSPAGCGRRSPALYAVSGFVATTFGVAGRARRRAGLDRPVRDPRMLGPLGLLLGMARLRTGSSAAVSAARGARWSPSRPHSSSEALRQALGDPALQLLYPAPDGGWVDCRRRARPRLPSPDDGRAATILEADGHVGGRHRPRCHAARRPCARPDRRRPRGSPSTTSGCRPSSRAARRGAGVAGPDRRGRRRRAPAARARSPRRCAAAARRPRRLAADDPARLGGGRRAGASPRARRRSGRVRAALDELRELARGSTRRSCRGRAWARPSRRSPTGRRPGRVDARRGRLPPEIETAAYFVACEALANVASTPRVRVDHRAQREDDGYESRSPTTAPAAPTRTARPARARRPRRRARTERLASSTAPGGGTRVEVKPCAS